MSIVVNEQLHLSEFCAADKPALIAHLNERAIYDRTLRIPYPYTEASADEWLKIAAQTTRQQGRPVCWAVRQADEFLIGGVGFEGFQAGKSHRAEIGYWLAKPYWGRGIMTAVVRAVCAHGFQELDLRKITAHVFAGNDASARVLTKCGFVQEGFLREHYDKADRLIDALLFGLLRNTASP